MTLPPVPLDALRPSHWGIQARFRDSDGLETPLGTTS